MENYLNQLIKFYENLYGNLIIQKKLKQESVLLSLFEVKSNVRFRLLKDSSIPSYKIPKNILNELIDKNLVRQTDLINEYTLTAKGIWEVENNSKSMNENMLIEYVDQKFFDLFGGDKSLTDKEKVIIFSMITARTFSEKSAINLKMDQKALEAWENIIEKVFKKIKALGVISIKDLEKLYGRTGNEHKVSHLIRHTDPLPKKTGGLYKAPGNQRYYLDLYQDSKLSTENLTYLFKLIFEDKLNDIDKEELIRFCNEIAWDESIYIFEDLKEHKFLTSDYDEILRESIREMVFS